MRFSPPTGAVIVHGASPGSNRGNATHGPISQFSVVPMLNHTKLYHLSVVTTVAEAPKFMANMAIAVPTHSFNFCIEAHPPRRTYFGRMVHTSLGRPARTRLG